MKERYAAKLLFQWRPVRAGVSRARRVCEERTLVLKASSAEIALRKANRAGKAGEFDHPIPGTKDGHVFFEFVGVRQLMDLGAECEENEVWYEIREILQPAERAKQLIPPKRELFAFRGRIRKRRLRPW